jgi:hypothetical protein
VGESHVVYFAGKPLTVAAPPVPEQKDSDEVKAWARFAADADSGERGPTLIVPSSRAARAEAHPESSATSHHSDATAGLSLDAAATQMSSGDGGKVGVKGAAQSPAARADARRTHSTRSEASATSDRSASTQSSSALPWKPVLKTKLCKTWMAGAGGCRYGSKCMFAHGEDDLVVVQTVPAGDARSRDGSTPSRSVSTPNAYVSVHKSDVNGKSDSR